MANAPRPQPLPVTPEAIPVELKALPQWVIWRYFWLADRQQWDKPPLNAHGGNAASSTNPATWSTFDRAMASYAIGRYDGIGLVIRPRNGLVGIDLDHCRHPDTGEVEVWALEIVHAIDSYTEMSPSGTGLRLWVRGTLPPGGRKQGQIEMYIDGRYLTVTGHHLPETPTTIERRQEAINALHTQVFGPRASSRTTMAAVPIDGERPQLDDDELLAKALGARNGEKFARLWSGDPSEHPSHSEADLALCSLLAFWTQDVEQVDRLFRRSRLYRPKWDREDYRAWTITKALAAGRQHWQPEPIPNDDPEEQRYQQSMKRRYLCQYHIPEVDSWLGPIDQLHGIPLACIIIRKEASRA
jgi:putative DNA primase/helicase